MDLLTRAVVRKARSDLLPKTSAGSILDLLAGFSCVMRFTVCINKLKQSMRRSAVNQINEIDVSSIPAHLYIIPSRQSGYITGSIPRKRLDFENYLQDSICDSSSPGRS